MLFIGTDIVEVGRIADFIRHWPQRFPERIFTTQERVYCDQQALPAVHYAGRFAAKEAARKALHAAGHQLTVPFKAIDIQRDRMGVPRIILGNNALGDTAAENLAPFQLALSISHTDQFAIATVVLETDG